MTAILFILCIVTGTGFYVGVVRPFIRAIARIFSKGH